MDCGDVWDEDWEPILEGISDRVVQQDPAPSGYTMNSRACSSWRPANPAIAVGASPRGKLERTSPSISYMTEDFDGAITRSPTTAHGGKRVISLRSLHRHHIQVQRTEIPPEHHEAPQVQRRPLNIQQLRLPRHRTLLKHALDEISTRLSFWRHHKARLQRPASDPNHEHGGPAPRKSPTSGRPQAVVPPSAEQLEQLKAVLVTLQGAIQEAQRAGRDGVTRGDLDVLWRLCTICWDAAAAAARAGGSVLGAAEQCRVLQDFGSLLYDMANEQPALVMPGAVAYGEEGGNGSDIVRHDLELFARIEVFLRLGRTWRAVGNLQQAGWFLARAREGLSQLAAAYDGAEAGVYEDGVQRAPQQRQQQQEERLQHGGAAIVTPDAEAPGEEVAEGGGADGAQEFGSGPGGGGSRGGRGGAPWDGLGVSASNYLGLEAAVLQESLQLALAEGHKALTANLLTQLRRLASSPRTPSEVAAASAAVCAAALMDAASAKLQSATTVLQPPPRPAAAAGEAAASGHGSLRLPAGAGLASQIGRGGVPDLRLRQEAASQEGLALLYDALGVLEEVLLERREELMGHGDRQVAAVGHGWRRQPRPRLTQAQAAGLSDTRCQVLKLLISGNLRLGNHEAALSYVREFGRPLHGNGMLHHDNGGYLVPEGGPGASCGVALHPVEAQQRKIEATSTGSRQQQAGALPLDVLLLSLRAHLGLGRMAEAAALLVHQIQPHEACTPKVIQVTLSRLLEAPLEQLLAALPGVTTCVIACLARCRQGMDGRVTPDQASGRRREQVTPEWSDPAGGSLVLQLASALAAHEGSVTENHLLRLLAHDDVVTSVCHTASVRERLRRLLFARAAAAYQEADHAAAARLFAAALLYASGGGGAPYCRTARMLSNCYMELGQTRRALGYLDLAAAHEPDTAAQLLLRLRLLLRMQSEEKGAVDVETERRTGVAASAGASDGAADAEALRLMDELLHCCDFEGSHLMVAYDIAARAHRHRVAVAAAQLAMRHLAAGPQQDGSAAPASLSTAVALVRNSLLSRFAEVGNSCNKDGRLQDSAGAFGRTAVMKGCGEGAGMALPYSTAVLVLEDLRWLCGRVRPSTVSAPSAWTSQVQEALVWIRDVAVALSHEALGGWVPATTTTTTAHGDVNNHCDEDERDEPGTDGHCSDGGDGVANGSSPDVTYGSARGDVDALEPGANCHQHGYWQCRSAGRQQRRQQQPCREMVGDLRAAAEALSCARQLDGLLRAFGAGSSSVGTQALETALVAVAAAMLQSYASGDVREPSVITSASRLLDTVNLPVPGPGREREAQAASQHPEGAVRQRKEEEQAQLQEDGEGRQQVLMCGLRATVLQLRFAAATFLRDPPVQKSALQALVEATDVDAGRLEALAELCLQPGSPWYCAPMACGVLGFAMRKALAAGAAVTKVNTAAGEGSADAAEPSVPARPGACNGGGSGFGSGVGIVARAIRRLFLLGSSEVRLRVCDRAAEFAAQVPQQPQSQLQAVCTGPGALPSMVASPKSPYPASELQYLWASCFNASLAEGQQHGWEKRTRFGAGGTAAQVEGVDTATIAGLTAASARGSRSRRLLDMAVKLAALEGNSIRGGRLEEGPLAVAVASEASEMAHLLRKVYDIVVCHGVEQGQRSLDVARASSCDRSTPRPQPQPQPSGGLPSPPPVVAWKCGTDRKEATADVRCEPADAPTAAGARADCDTDAAFVGPPCAVARRGHGCASPQVGGAKRYPVVLRRPASSARRLLALPTALEAKPVTAVESRVLLLQQQQKLRHQQFAVAGADGSKTISASVIEDIASAAVGCVGSTSGEPVQESVEGGCKLRRTVGWAEQASGASSAQIHPPIMLPAQQAGPAACVPALDSCDDVAIAAAIPVAVVTVDPGTAWQEPRTEPVRDVSMQECLPAAAGLAAAAVTPVFAVLPDAAARLNAGPEPTTCPGASAPAAMAVATVDMQAADTTTVLTMAEETAVEDADSASKPSVAVASKDCCSLSTPEGVTTDPGDSPGDAHAAVAGSGDGSGGEENDDLESWAMYGDQRDPALDAVEAEVGDDVKTADRSRGGRTAEKSWAEPALACNGFTSRVGAGSQQARLPDACVAAVAVAGISIVTTSPSHEGVPGDKTVPFGGGLDGYDVSTSPQEPAPVHAPGAVSGISFSPALCPRAWPKHLYADGALEPQKHVQGIAERAAREGAAVGSAGTSDPDAALDTPSPAAADNGAARCGSGGTAVLTPMAEQADPAMEDVAVGCGSDQPAASKGPLRSRQGRAPAQQQPLLGPMEAVPALSAPILPELGSTMPPISHSVPGAPACDLQQGVAGIEVDPGGYDSGDGAPLGVTTAAHGNGDRALQQSRGALKESVVPELTGLLQGGAQLESRTSGSVAVGDPERPGENNGAEVGCAPGTVPDGLVQPLGRRGDRYDAGGAAGSVGAEQSRRVGDGGSKACAAESASTANQRGGRAKSHYGDGGDGGDENAKASLGWGPGHCDSPGLGNPFALPLGDMSEPTQQHQQQRPGECMAKEPQPSLPPSRQGAQRPPLPAPQAQDQPQLQEFSVQPKHRQDGGLGAVEPEAANAASRAVEGSPGAVHAIQAARSAQMSPCRRPDCDMAEAAECNPAEVSACIAARTGSPAEVIAAGAMGETAPQLNGDSSGPRVGGLLLQENKEEGEEEEQARPTKRCRKAGLNQPELEGRGPGAPDAAGKGCSGDGARLGEDCNTAVLESWQALSCTAQDKAVTPRGSVTPHLDCGLGQPRGIVGTVTV